MKIKPSNQEFQCPTVENNVTVASEAMERGMKIFHSTVMCPAPSI